MKKISEELLKEAIYDAIREAAIEAGKRSYGVFEDNGEKEPGAISTWENGNLTSFTEVDRKYPWVSYIYDNKTYNGFFPLFYEYTLWNDEWYIFMAQPELIGIKTKNLPKMIIDDPYTSLLHCMKYNRVEKI